MLIGISDALRGQRETDRRRRSVGLCQAIIGAGAVTAALIAPAATACSAVMVAALLTRQMVLGLPPSEG